MGSAEQELATTVFLAVESNAPSLAETVKFRQGMGQVSRQSFVFLAGSMFTTAAGYFFKIYLARFLGAELLGTYALGMTVVGFAGLFSTLGLSGAAPRFVAVYAGSGDVVQRALLVVLDEKSMYEMSCLSGTFASPRLVRQRR